MPTFLGRPYSTAWRGDPPHMLKEDVPIWYRWLGIYAPRITALYYDVLLGGPILTPQQEKDTYWKLWRTSTSKRADAIAEVENAVWIIEVARRPGLRAVGQLLVYRTLWLEDPKISKLEKMLLVFEELDKDLIAAAAQVGIVPYVMPPPRP